jgi:hypothetical protein
VCRAYPYEARVVKFRLQCAVAGKAKHVSGFKISFPTAYDRALKSQPGGNSRTTVFMQPYPIYATRGEGCRVFDVDGNEHIDCINNHTSLIHGRAHPVLVEAAARQLALGSAFGLPTRSEVELAELLASRLPSVEQVRFTNSGTEAAMIGRSATTGRPTGPNRKCGVRRSSIGDCSIEACWPRATG